MPFFLPETRSDQDNKSPRPTPRERMSRLEIADHLEKMKRVPFNANNPDGPLEICLCADCNAVLMLDDKQKRIRVAVPNVMGYDDAHFPKATYHAFWDESKGYAKPHDGRPVYEALQPSFHWPKGA